MVTFSFTSAVANTADLKDEDDKKNADATLTRLQAFADFPGGWLPREVLLRPGVVAYLRLHAVKLFDVRPCEEGMLCATVVV